MFRRISRVTSFLTLTTILIFSIFFSGVISVDSSEITVKLAADKSLSPESNGDNPLRIVIEPVDENQNTENSRQRMTSNNYPDLGS